MVMATGKNLTRLAGVMPASSTAGAVPTAWYESGVITAVTVGAASDGNNLVTVAWRGGTYDMPFLASYAPTVGHTVLLLAQHPQAVILGRVIGTP
jgi:hypothetical protein